MLITGASQGYGRCLALDFVRLLQDEGLDLYLWARNEAGLKETERLAHMEWTMKATASELRCFVESVDLSNSSDYASKMDELRLQVSKQSYDRVYVVHNAGSLGKLGLVQECASSLIELSHYWELNVTSVIWLNKSFLDMFGASTDSMLVSNNLKPTQLVIVNITSLCGITPFKTHMMYCTGKAAREMHHRVIAAEQAAFDKVRVLQYSPGPMDTDMQQTLRILPTVDSELQKQFIGMKAAGKLIPPAQSSARGVKLAISGDYESGSHVDYYDLDV